MKKKLSLLFFALLSSVSGAWATATPSYVQVTSVYDLVDGGKYVIRVNGGSYITENNSQYVAPNAQNEITDNAIFTFHKNGDAWTVECEATGNYWSTLPGAATGNFTPVAAESAGSWTFSFNGNNIVPKSGDYYINRSSGVMHGWTSTIALQIYTEVPVIAAIDDFSNNKAYYVTTADRGAWFVPSGGTALTSTTKAGFGACMGDSKQQFAFLTYGTTGVYHLYSVTEKKFVSKSGQYTTLTSELGDNVTLLTGTGNANYPVVVALQDGAYQMGISNGYSPAVITFWNSLSDGGNQVQIREVADFDPTEAMAILEAAYSTTVTVTYEVYDGATFVESLNVVQDKNSAVSIPAALQKNTWYYDYTASGTIGTTDCTITVARTYKSGVVTSLAGLSNNKAYTLVTERGTFTTDNGALANTCRSGSNYTVYNFAIINYENAYYLWSVQDGKFVAGSDTDLTETPTPITINTLTEPLFKIQCGSNYLNCNVNSGGFFSGWSATDGGNMVAIIEAADFDPAPVIDALTDVSSSVVTNIKPFFDAAGSGLFQLKSSVAATYNDIYTAALTSCSTSTYATLEGVVTNVDNFNLPENGKFYAIKNLSNNKYLDVKSANGIYADVDAPTTGSIVQAVIRNGKTYFATQGKEFGWCYGSGNAALLDAAGGGKYAHFCITAPGQVAFAHCIGNGEGTYESYLPSSYYAVGNNNQIFGGATTAATAQWIFEEESTVNVVLNSVGDKSYATLCVPYDCTISGATAYTLSLNSSETGLTFSEGLTTIPAGTPVLLVGTTTSATLSLASNAAYQASPLTTTALTGTYLAKAVDGATDYFLGMVDSKVGFYHWDGSTLSANRAYFEASKLTNGNGDGVKGFAFDFEDDATGIVSSLGETEEGAIFNLAGQRMNKMQKGINIINGKKILK